MTAASTVDSTQGSFDFRTLNAKSTTAANANSTTATQDRFLKLLVTQLKNQDPLNPLDNAQMTSQMAQISTVDGIDKLNTTLQAMMDNANTSQSLQAAALVGHGVLVPGKVLEYKAASGDAYGGIDLSGAADGVSVTITDANGLAMRTLNLGAMAAGTHTFQWDGKTDNGSAVADGKYTLSVTAKQGQNKVDASSLQLGMVSSVISGSQGVSLNVGPLGAFKMSDVKEIL
ncbi:MAG: flagellar hook assembly protein FlgD [Betaproteobacteria bacterium]|nr:flagellar hook assembly protein FlgD [Betaproteobacteria bacterium]